MIKGEEMKLAFNGKMLFRKITGVERYAHEVFRELDNMIGYHEYTLLIPGDCDSKLLQFKNFKIVSLNGFKNHMLWEQFSLAWYAKNNRLTIVNFDFSTPVLCPGISIIHDMSFKANPQFWGKSWKTRMTRAKLNLFSYSLTRSGNPIMTLTGFQKQEIIKYYGIPAERIHVTGAGWQHFERVSEDKQALEKYGLCSGKYYFSLSSNTPNKNFKWIYNAAHKNPNACFVIAGGTTSVTSELLQNERNIVCTGYVSDETIKALYRHCKAFIFPSYYEGFGMPPLEALSSEAKIILSNSSCLPEVYGKCAYYIDPDDAEVDLDLLLEEQVAEAKGLLEKYSWQKTAAVWKTVLDYYVKT